MNLPPIIPIVDGPMGWGVSAMDTRAGYILYQCPGCGRTMKRAMVSIYQINTTCTCNFPTCVYMMNIVGSWKHPNWIEFDERTYWEEKGLITEGPYIPYYVKTEEELWMESLKKGFTPTPLNGCAPNVKATTEKKSPSLITITKTLWQDFWRHPQP